MLELVESRQIIDIDDKDIVIGMLQSLSMKDYPYTFLISDLLLLMKFIT